jgi:hypothetical protein
MVLNLKPLAITSLWILYKNMSLIIFLRNNWANNNHHINHSDQSEGKGIGIVKAQPGAGFRLRYWENIYI